MDKEIRVSGYCSKLNRAARADESRWRVVWSDAFGQYAKLYRTEKGARADAEHHNRLRLAYPREFPGISEYRVEATTKGA